MRVGTSFAFCMLPNIRGDHPHACGDKNYVQIAFAGVAGSSPCVWGQAQYCFAVACGHRIIPMRVGTRHCQANP